MNPIIIMLVALFGSVLLVILFRPVIAWLHEYVAVLFLYNAVKHAGLAYSKKDILSMHSHTDVLQEIGLRSMDLSQEVFVLITIIRIKLQKYNQDDVEEVYDLIDDVEEQLLAIIK